MTAEQDNSNQEPLPEGWTQERIERVLDDYETPTEEEALKEDHRLLREVKKESEGEIA